MQFYVRFKVVKRRVTILVGGSWILFTAGVAIFIGAAFIESIRFLQLYAAGSWVLGAVGLKSFRQYKTTGVCTLTDQEIIITSGENVTRYPLLEITALKLYFKGYWGMELKPIENSKWILPNFSDGAHNELVFRYNEEELRIGLKFYRRHLKEMNTLFAVWEEQGISYELWGRKNVGRKRFRV